MRALRGLLALTIVVGIAHRAPTTSTKFLVGVG
jgi:hypothetical protein